MSEATKRAADLIAAAQLAKEALALAGEFSIVTLVLGDNQEEVVRAAAELAGGQVRSYVSDSEILPGTSTSVDLEKDGVRHVTIQTFRKPAVRP